MVMRKFYENDVSNDRECLSFAWEGQILIYFPFKYGDDDDQYGEDDRHCPDFAREGQILEYSNFWVKWTVLVFQDQWFNWIIIVMTTMTKKWLK